MTHDRNNLEKSQGIWWYQTDFDFKDVPERKPYHQWIAYLDESKIDNLNDDAEKDTNPRL